MATNEFISEPTSFLEKLVYSDDLIATIDQTFGKKSDAKSEKAWFYRFLALQTKHGASMKKDAKSLAAAVGNVNRMNGNKKEGWAQPSARVENLLLRQQIIDFNANTAPNQKKFMSELKQKLASNLTADVVLEDRKAAKGKTYSASMDKSFGTPKLLKKKWDSLLSAKDFDLSKHFQPIAAWEFLCKQKLNDDHVSSFLALVADESANIDSILPFIKQDMTVNKTVFGSRKIHRRLTLREMDLLGKKSEDLQKNERFTEVWASKLVKVTDRDFRLDNELMGKSLDKLRKFAAEFIKGNASNSLKAFILYHYLAFQEKQGKHDKATLHEYLAIPKLGAYNKGIAANKKWKRPASFDYVIPEFPHLNAIGDDEPLVRRYLRALFAKADEKANKWTDVVDGNYLKAVIYETRLMHNTGKAADLSKNYTKLLGRYAYQKLEDRVIVEVTPDNREFYAVNEPVSFSLLVKNVPSLQIGVYEINANNYYKKFQSEVDINLSLDGLEPNFVESKKYKEAPLYLRPRKIDIASLKEKRGLFLIEFLGNGVRARALIRKGELRYVVRQEFKDENKDKQLEYVLTVVNEQNKQVDKAKVTLLGEEYESDEKGSIHIPFAAADAANSPIILEDLSRGGSTTLQHFNYQTENYVMESALYVDREQLLSRQVAKIFVRPCVYLNGETISVDNLRDPVLEVNAENGAGEIQVRRYRLRLSDKEETVVNWRVPTELRRVTLTMKARVYAGSRKSVEKLANTNVFAVNAVDDTNALGQSVLIPRKNDWVVQIMGKNGESLGRQNVKAYLTHRYFKKALEYNLTCNEKGDINLGPLPDITDVEIIATDDALFGAKDSRIKQKWALPQNLVNIPPVVNVKEGDAVLIPLMSESIQPRCDVYDKDYIRNYPNVQYNNGYLNISGLPSGDFIAMIRDKQCADVKIHVSKGIGFAGHIIADHRIVQLSERKALQITSVKGNRGGGYKVKLDGVDETCRVHAISSYGVANFSGFEFLAAPNTVPQVYDFPLFKGKWTAGEAVPSEQQYIANRRQQSKRGGNLLSRPTALLNRWTPDQKLRELPQALVAREEKAADAQQSVSVMRELRKVGSVDRMDFAESNLDLLPSISTVSVNLTPDNKGLVSIPAEMIDPTHSVLTIIATDDNNTSMRSEKLNPPSSVKFNDTRLVTGLSAKEHFSQVKEVIIKTKAEETHAFGNWDTTTLETYDDLSDIFELYYSLSVDNKNSEMKNILSHFTWLPKWGSFSNEDKMKYYDTYASNELNFFLKMRDEKFFADVVAPFVACRIQKTFFDYYLLGDVENMKRFERLDLFHTLNTLEQILLASVVESLGEKVLRMIENKVGLKPDNVQQFDNLFHRALAAKQVDVEDVEVESQLEAEREETDADVADLSKQYQDTRYYAVPLKKQSPDLVPVNAFWLDFATFLLGKSEKKIFLSPNFGFAANNANESLLALGALAMPYRGDNDAPSVVYKVDGKAVQSYTQGAEVEVTVYGPTMLLTRQVLATKSGPSGLSVSTNYFDPLDLFETVDFEKVDKFVRSPLLSGKIYGCRVVVTNVSSFAYSAELLSQLPTGAIAVNGGFRTRTQLVNLQPYATAHVEYFFYFPEQGSYEHFPAHVSRNHLVIGWSLDDTKIEVQNEESVKDKSSYKYLVHQALVSDDKKSLLAFLKSDPRARRVDLSKMALVCADAKFFAEATMLLRRRGMYEASIWRYALVHNAAEQAAEYLAANETFMAQLAPDLTACCSGDSLFAEYDATEFNTYTHGEFWSDDDKIWGLFNARAHSNDVLNKHSQFAAAYRQFLIRTLYRSHGVPSMPVGDKLSAIFYLIAQNRIKEAVKIFRLIKSEETKQIAPMVFDYLRVFMSFYNTDVSKAKAMEPTVHKYLKKQLPPSKQKAWQFALKQIQELQDHQRTSAEFTEEKEAKTKLDTAPKLDFKLDKKTKKIIIRYKNLLSVTLNFYQIDVEMLFSTAPFRAARTAFNWVSPTLIEVAALEAGKPTHEIAIPEKFVDQNFVIEAIADGITLTKPQYDNSMQLHVSKERNELFVGNFSRFPLSKAYVKVYMKTESNPDGVFLKDGYTDLRGRFDYLTVANDSVKQASAVAILVMTEQCGSTVVEIEL